MKNLMIGLFILLSIKSNAQIDTIFVTKSDEMNFKITPSFGYDNDIKHTGKIISRNDTVPCAFMIIDTTDQNNIFNQAGSRIYYVTGYKVSVRKGEQTYWADHSCPSHMLGCLVYHTTWIESELPVINHFYLSFRKQQFTNKNYVYHELK